MKLKVGVLFGGESVEHEISIISALQAMNALDKDKYEVIPIYVSKKRDFYTGEALKQVETYLDMKELERLATRINLVKEGNQVVVQAVKRSLFSKNLNTVDVVIPVVHGTNVEDGTVQGYLEMLKVPYAGPDVIASAVGQDKVLMRHILESEGIPQTPWFWTYSHEIEENEDSIKAKAANLGYPLVLKPACLGSSVGIEIVHNEDELMPALEECSQYDFKICIEKMVKPMREVNCSVLGSCFDCKPSVIEEVMKDDEHDILDFKDKYLGNKGSKGAKGVKAPVKTGSKGQGMASASRQVPANLPEGMTERVQDLAVRTYKALGSAGVCRIDCMINPETDEIFVNEINNIPGSLSFYLWQPAGVDFTELMDRLVSQALDRARRKEKMTFSYDTNVLANFKAGTKGAKGSKA